METPPTETSGFAGSPFASSSTIPAVPAAPTVAFAVTDVTSTRTDSFGSTAVSLLIVTDTGFSTTPAAKLTFPDVAAKSAPACAVPPTTRYDTVTAVVVGADNVIGTFSSSEPASPSWTLVLPMLSVG